MRNARRVAQGAVAQLLVEPVARRHHHELCPQGSGGLLWHEPRQTQDGYVKKESAHAHFLRFLLWPSPMPLVWRHLLVTVLALQDYTKRKRGILPLLA